MAAQASKKENIAQGYKEQEIMESRARLGFEGTI